MAYTSHRTLIAAGFAMPLGPGMTPAAAARDQAPNILQVISDNQPAVIMNAYDGPYLNPPTDMGTARNRYFESYRGRAPGSFPVQRINEQILKQISGPDPGEDYQTARQFMEHFLYNALRVNADADTRAIFSASTTWLPRSSNVPG